MKNIIVNLMFLKILLKNCAVSLRFFKKNGGTINILRAPSRHKKFMHQYRFEFFFVILDLTFQNLKLQKLKNSTVVALFLKMVSLFGLFNSNLLTQTKFNLSLVIRHSNEANAS